LALADDMRIISGVELMAIREAIHDDLAPYDQPVGDRTFEVLREASRKFETWYTTWDSAFSRRYEDAGMVHITLISSFLIAFSFPSAKPLNPTSSR
jgi:predicted kinase